ncbi:SRPBCC domain-containing protein [Flavobacterium litorale]|uniref:SRPBCC domain-containing protein n=1 Tax=Flavobacterium litorale TaxID=2856519 RepID=A0ABX8VAG7_9FLAO|nr:SRPBCC domain-containing protein [Flavobacterium litorale]QYJ68031.1 SRPBCC domain-containing protein [Flavobacterium litorale]
MSQSLIVENSIRIDAPVIRVWEVLTKSHYVRQWKNLPEDFGDFEVLPATVINLPGSSTMTIVEFEPNKKLYYHVVLPEWVDQQTNIGYTYNLSTDENGHTWLGIQVGDFALITEGNKYYDESVMFGKTASQKIKELAEMHDNTVH